MQSAGSGSGRAKSEDSASFVDPTDDTTYQSLKRLLSASSTSTQHLSLLSQDTLYGSITYYLSKLEVQYVAEFIGIINSSGCLWAAPSSTASNAASVRSSDQSKISWTTESKAVNNAPATSKSSIRPEQDSSVSLSAFLIARASAITQAVALAMTRRIDLIIKQNKDSTGWRSRSGVSDLITAIFNGLNATEQLDIPESYKSARGLPISKFAIVSGLLNGLYVLKDQRRKRRDMSIMEEMAALRTTPALGLNIRRHLNVVEDEWIVIFAEILDTLQGPTIDIVQTEHAAAQQESTDTDDDVDDWEKEFRKRSAEVADAASPATRTSQQAKRAALEELRDVPLYMAAQLAPLVPDRKIQALDPVQLAATAADALLCLFEAQSHTSFLASLSTDLVSDSDGLVSLKPDSATVRSLRAISSSTLFPLLGPLSKLLSRALAKAVTSLSPDDLSSLLMGTSIDTGLGQDEFFPIIVRMSRLGSQLERSWLDSPLAGLSDDSIDPKSKKDTTQLWTIFKTVLFSYTMVFDSMMTSVVEMCPSPTLTIPPMVIGETAGLVDPSLRDRKWPPASTSNLPPPYLLIVQTILATFSHLYWITSTFGSDGFDVYRKVFYSSLDVLGRDGEACVQFLELIGPEQVDGFGLLQSNTAKRSSTTYFLNVAEQLVPAVPDEVVERMILPICRPYLEDTRFQDTFESAHSVVLALYSNKKRCTLELAPFYVDLLLSSFPKQLTSTQLEYAFTTVVTALSDRSDSLSWWTIDRLFQEIESERVLQHTSRQSSSQQGGYAESMVSKREVDEATSMTESAHPSTPDSTSIRADSDMHDRLISLQMCYIAVVPCVNLVLLRSALRQVELYILRQKEIEDEVDYGQTSTTRRVELCEKAFEAVQGLNAATREEGLRWWLDNRSRFGV